MTMAKLRVQLRGGFQVERDGIAITAFHSQKAQSLLAYLLIYRDRSHPRSALANLFWGESGRRDPPHLHCHRGDLIPTHTLQRQVLLVANGQIFCVRPGLDLDDRARRDDVNRRLNLSEVTEAGTNGDRPLRYSFVSSCFAVMTAEKIKKAFTFDRDFLIAGFQVLP